jgi:stage III sporulation protein AF
MASLGQWLKVLIVVVLLGNLVEFALPKGDLKRYGGLVVGLVILAAVVSPLWGWLRSLNGQAAVLPSAGWTNSPTGFSTVVEAEELHQAEAIIMSMPGVSSCRLATLPDATVMAQVTAQSNVPAERLRHYVRAALKATMGSTPRVSFAITRR